MFYTTKYDEHLWRLAAARAKATPVFEGSYRGVDANEVGALGEVVFERLLQVHGIPYKSVYATTHDLEVFGDTIDVKTKDRTVRPKLDFDCSVPLYNHDFQRPDRYVFVSLQRDKDDRRQGLERFRRAYVVGWCSLELIDRTDVGKVWHEDDVDPSNGTRFWTDCKTLPSSACYRLGTCSSSTARTTVASD